MQEFVGLGCASMLGRYSKGDSIRILSHAYSEGIRHFDVARSYGYGEAESLLGRVFKSSSDIKISTKFGVVPMRKAKLFSFAKPFIRPFIRKKVPSSLLIDYKNENVIDEELLKSSISASLKALQVDQVYRLFVHEPPSSWAIDSGLSNALEGLVEDGTICGWGVSGYVDSINEISHNPLNLGVTNFQSSLNLFNYPDFKELKLEAIFSLFHRGYVIKVLDDLAKNKAFTSRFEVVFGCDYLEHSSAFWAVALMAAVTDCRMVLATKSCLSLDESLSAIGYGKRIDFDVAEKSILTIREGV